MTKFFKRGDIVRISSDVTKIMETQWAPEEYAKHCSGGYAKIICSYPDNSYDLEGTALKLDNSVLEYVGHQNAKAFKKCQKKGHTYSEEFHEGKLCNECLEPR